MFCPQCEAEYRPGFTRCSDCYVDLVDKLPEPSKDPVAPLSDPNLKEVWVGKDQEQCVAFCSDLRESKIPYHVIQHQPQVFKDVQGNYTIGVLPEFYDRARKIIEQGNLDDSNFPESNLDVEIPAQDDKPPTDDDDLHVDWKDEAPDDATVEIATESTRDLADMLVLALRENDIETRTVVLRDGSRKIFVPPHDESRAREIVHEIQTDTPPE